MTYSLAIQNDFPAAFWPLDGNTNDVTMRGYDATATGTLADHQSLVAGTGEAAIITNTDYLIYEIPVFRTRPVTLEAWVRSLDIADKSDVLGQDNFGIYITPTHIGASVELENDNVYTAEIKVYDKISHHVVMTFDGRSLTLYVDNESLTKDLLAEDYGVPVKNGTVANTIYSRGSVGSNFVIDCPAVYGYVLSKAIVDLHYRRGRNVMSVQSIVTQYGGTYYEISDDSADVYRRVFFDDRNSWLSGRFSDVGVTDRIDALTEDGLTIEGTWEYAWNLSDPDGFTIDGIKIDWHGENETVEYNINDAGWTSIQRRSMIPIPMGQSLTEFILELRVTLTSGQAESYVAGLKLTAYSDFELNSVGLPTVSTPAVIADVDTEPIANDDNRGTEGIVTISAMENWEDENLVSTTTVNVGSGLSEHEETEFIPLDGGNFQYKMDASSASVATAGASLKFYDRDQLEILPEHFMFYDDTETTLAEELTEGSTHIVLADATNYPDATTRPDEGRGMIFWNYEDYGTRQYSRYSYDNLWTAGAIVGNTIELTTPWTGPTIPEGTPVNSYRSVAPTALIDMNLTSSSQPFEIELTPTIKDGEDIDGIYPGAAYARLYFSTPDSVDYSFTNIHLKQIGQEPYLIHGVEAWVKFNGAVSGTIISVGSETLNATLTPSDGYRFFDGSTSPSINIVENKWHHIIWVFITPITGEIVAGATNLQIGHLATYETEPDGQSLYSLYSGNPTKLVDDISNVEISAAAEEVDSYAYDWTLSAVIQ